MIRTISRIADRSHDTDCAKTHRAMLPLAVAKISSCSLSRTSAALAALLPLFGGVAVADGTVTVGTTNIVDFKGWGVFPAPYDRQTPTYSDGSTAHGDASWLPASGARSDTTSTNGVYLALKDLSFDIGRVYISPTIGKTDNTLDSARMQDLKDQIQTLKNMGVTKYTMTVWSPPTHMKLPDRVRYGKYEGRNQYLDPAFADGTGYDFADFYVAVLNNLKAAGYPAPVSVSVQNEPGIAHNYDGCFYEFDNSSTGGVNGRALYRTVVKQLRTKLNAAGFNSVPIIGPESDGLSAIAKLLGEPSSSGFVEMNADTEFRNAIGGFGYHTYTTTNKVKSYNQAMAFYSGRDRWMTEFSSTFGTGRGIRGELRPYETDSTALSGNTQLNTALNTVRRMAADFVDIKTNYWFFWRGYHSGNQLDYPEDLFDGSGNKAKLAHVLTKIWQTVDPGWKVKQVTDTEPDLRSDNNTIIATEDGNVWSAPIDIIAFESGNANKSCLVISNWKNAAKNITGLSGLKGGQARIFVTTATQDMAEQTARSISSGTLQGGNLTLPAYSITVITTAGGLGALSINEADSVSSPTVNLTNEGTADWWHWGINSTLLTGERKNITTANQVITGISRLSSVNWLSTINNAGNQTNHSWTDGIPTASSTGTRSSIYSPGVNNGFQVNLKADTTTRTAKIYVGVKGKGQLTASLSDGAVAALSSAVVTDANWHGKWKVYTVTYSAASANQTLSLKWKLTDQSNTDWGWTGIQAVSVASSGAVTTTSGAVTTTSGAVKTTSGAVKTTRSRSGGSS